jgi:hypothetical protein
MRLYIAGVCHFDPTGRARLLEWLEQLSEEHSEPPAFVAVEYDSDLFTKIKAQRARFRCLLTEHWPHAMPDFLDELELSLGYEGDTHERVFPDARIIWIDQGRMYNVEGFAEGRLIMYHQFLGEQGLLEDTAAALAILSQRALEAAGPPTEGNERDARFARLIIQAIADGSGDWAIVVVGANHASDCPGRMRCLLEQVGQTCEVTILAR